MIILFWIRNRIHQILWIWIESILVFFFFLKSYACFCSIIFLAKTKNWAKIINSTSFPEKAKTLLFYSSSLYLQEFVKKIRKTEIYRRPSFPIIKLERFIGIQ